MYRIEKFKYELTPYAYFLLGMLVEFNSSSIGQTFAGLLIVAASWIIAIRLYYRGYLGNGFSRSSNDVSVAAVKRLEATPPQAKKRDSLKSSQAAWTYAAGIDGYTVEE